MTRMIFLGKPTKKELDIYNFLLKAQQAAIKAAKVNKPYKALDVLTRKKLGKHEKYFIHSLGHGIGLEVHENPSFGIKTHKILNNVPFTIEPGIYFPGKFGLRIEDTLVMKQNKPKILTIAPKKLPIIENW